MFQSIWFEKDPQVIKLGRKIEWILCKACSLSQTHTHTHSLTHTHSHTLVHMLIHKSKQSHTLFLPSHSPTVSSTCTYHHCLLHSHSQTHTLIFSFSFSQLTKPQLTYTERKGCKSACVKVGALLKHTSGCAGDGNRK